ARHHRSGGLLVHHDSDQQFLSHAVFDPSAGGLMIEARQLKKSFGPQRVLDGVDLRVEKGESVVIIGRSGGGKSILLKHLIGLLRPDQGDVIIDGENIAGMNERQLLKVRRKCGMLFQGAALFDSLTVAENVAFVFQREGKLTEPEISKKVDQALDRSEERRVGKERREWRTKREKEE